MNRKGMLEFVEELIETPSQSGHEEKVAELLSGKMRELGYKVTRDQMGNVIGKITGKDSTCPILFDGHMDTVGPGESRNWMTDPFVAETINGRLVGRGTVDMKGSLAAMIYGCSEAKPESDLYVACVVHEETYEGVALNQVIESIRIRLRAVVLGEPTSLDLSIGQRGRSVFKIATRGRTAHASMPELGANAIYMMAPIVEEISRRNEELRGVPPLGKGSMAVTSIRAAPGEGPIVPDLCEILVDRRLTQGETLESTMKELGYDGSEVELVKGELKCYTGLRMQVEEYFPTWLLDERHPLVELCLRALSAVLVRRPKTTVWKFSTDGVASAGILGIPTIGFGPGDPSQAHQPNESIDLREVAIATEGFRALAEALSRA